MSYTSITLTGTYAGGGTSDSVVFELTAPMRQVGGSTVSPVPIAVNLNSSGHFSQVLNANNDPATLPEGVAYSVTVRVGASVDQFYVIVPYDAAGGTVDISALVRVIPTPYPNTNVLSAESLGVPGGPAKLDGEGFLPESAMGGTAVEDVVRAQTLDSLTPPAGALDMNGFPVINAPSNISGGAVFSSQSFTSGTAFQPSTTSDVELVVVVTHSGILSLQFGPTTGTENGSVVIATVVAGTIITKIIPAGWRVVLTLASSAAASITKMTLHS